MKTASDKKVLQNLLSLELYFLQNVVCSRLFPQSSVIVKDEASFSEILHFLPNSWFRLGVFRADVAARFNVCVQQDSLVIISWMA